ALRNAAAQHGRRRARGGAHRTPVSRGGAGQAASVRDRRAGGRARVPARRPEHRGGAAGKDPRARTRAEPGGDPRRASVRRHRPRRGRPPRARARDARGAERPFRRGARVCQPRRGDALAAPQLPRGALRAGGCAAAERRGARGRLLPRPRRLPAAALAARRRRPDLLLPRRARADRTGRGRLRRRAAALARRVHRTQRTLGEGGGCALLPSPHAALPHPPRRAADGARPLQRAQPHRVLARAARTGARAVRIGVPTEIKPDEYRVAITPAGVRELSAHGHAVLVQAGAGEGSAFSDADFERQGASIVPHADDIFEATELVLKGKEPQPVEVQVLHEGQTLFTYLHLAAEPELARGLQESGATCIAYETVEDSAGHLPLLAPMSEVAGKIATQAGAFMLEKPLGGRGILLG